MLISALYSTLSLFRGDFRGDFRDFLVISRPELWQIFTRSSNKYIQLADGDPKIAAAIQHRSASRQCGGMSSLYSL
jgi:hypothetical protein